MLVKSQLIPSFVGGYVVSLCRSSGSFYELFKVFHWVFTLLDNQEFFFVHLQNKACGFLIERENTSNQYRANHQQFFHFLFLLLGFVLFLNVDIFSACSPADCNLYESSYYQGCSPTSGNNQYQCGGGSGSCSDVCGGCGFRIRTAGYLNRYQKELDDYCSQYHPCPHGDAKCTGLRPLRTIAIGLCGVGYESDFDIEAICGCINRSSSSVEVSSSSSALSSSSSLRVYFECNNPNKENFLCYNSKGNCPGCALCSLDWFVSQLSSSCYGQGYCGFTTTATSSNECQLGRSYNTSPPTQNLYINCIPCPSSSSTEPSSSAASSDSGSSSDSGEGGGGSDGGESSSGSGGGGSGGDGGVIPCGWGEYPPCIVDPIDPPFCELYPELCYVIGGLDDTLSRYGSAITDSLGRLIGILDTLDLDGGGSCLDSADCPPADFSGDSIPFVPGDSSESGSGGGSGSDGVYSWLRSVLSAASIPAAARSCPSFPSVEIELGDDTQILDFDICKEELHIGGYHPLELFGIILRAISCLIAVYVALGAVTSLNAGFHKMRRLGG